MIKNFTITKLKSGIMMQLGQQIAYANQEPTPQNPFKAFVLYFSLDDNNNELLPRLVAIDQKIPINAVRFPKKYRDNKSFMERRDNGFRRLKKLVMNLAMMDSNEGSDIEFIEETVERYVNELALIDENYKIVVMIDNFHDITVRDIKFGSDNNGKYDHIADGLSKIATRFDCPIICTAEFRKINGNKRPALEDIRESVKIVYEAKVIMLCHNEVGLRGEQANIYWEREDMENKQPVYEVHVGKNKFSSFKGRMYYEFTPEMSYFREVNDAADQIYNQMVTG